MNFRVHCIVTVTFFQLDGQMLVKPVKRINLSGLSVLLLCVLHLHMYELTDLDPVAFLRLHSKEAFLYQNSLFLTEY